MRKVVKLTESDLENIIRKIVSEQEKIELPTKELKSVITPMKAAEIKSQADSLAKNTELIQQTLKTIKMIDPEAYHMLTRGEDPIKTTPLGTAVVGGALISLIYTIIQELKGQ